MSAEIEIYRGGTMELAQRLPLMTVLRPALERLTGMSLDKAVILLHLWRVEEEHQELMDIYNMAPTFGYATVNIVALDAERVLYRHPHPVSELICRQLREMLDQQHPTRARWGFCIAGSNIPRTPVTIPPPRIAGAFEAASSDSGPRPKLRISKVPDPPAPPASLRAFGLTLVSPEQQDALLKVLVRDSVMQELKAKRPFSDQVEEGGFLVGRVYEDAERPQTFVVEITGAPRAESTGASLLHLTFTGDSFAEIKRRLRGDLAEDQLLGWYHTHLFPASIPMGLSSIDLELHFSTFQKPWQVAGLINLDGQSQRTLRFYVRQAGLMVPCPQWYVPDPVAPVESPS